MVVAFVVHGRRHPQGNNKADSHFALQLELHAHEQLDKVWRRLAKRDAKAAQSDSAHVPAAKQPEAVFLPDMLHEFLQVSLHSQGAIVFKLLHKFLQLLFQVRSAWHWLVLKSSCLQLSAVLGAYIASGD